MSLHWLGGVLGGSRPSTRANSSSRTRVRPSCTCGRSRTIQNCSKWKATSSSKQGPAHPLPQHWRKVAYSHKPGAESQEPGSRAVAVDWRRCWRGKLGGSALFVAIGAPTEPLPELGAVRAYFSNDTWQSAIIRWIDLAALIIKVIGPTKWIRWELDTIIERNALSKLIILMPPGWPADRAARWQNVLAGLQSTRWGSSLAMVDSETVVAIGFFDDGGLSIVTGGKRRYIDYLLAFRLMLYQLKNRPAPSVPQIRAWAH